MKRYSFFNLITIILLIGKSTIGLAARRQIVYDSCAIAVLAPPEQEQAEQYISSQQTIETFIRLNETIKGDAASSVFIAFAKTYLGKNIEDFMGTDWRENIVEHTQSWEKQDAIDFLIFLARRIGVGNTLNAIKDTSTLREMLYKPFRDKVSFLEQYLGINRFINMLEKTPLKDLAPNNVRGVSSNIWKVESIIGEEQTSELVESEVGAFTVTSTEIYKVEQYLREDRGIPVEIVNKMIIENIRDFMNASLPYLQARVSYVEGMSGASKEDVNQMIIEHFPAFVENYFTYNRSPLHVSVYVGDVNLADSLIERRINDVNAIDLAGWASLHIASLIGDENMTSRLIERGADVNKADKMGLAPVHVAVDQQNKNIVSLLTEHDEIDVNIPDKMGWTPLLLAASKGDIDIAALLLDAGADIDYRDSNTGQTALQIALYREDIKFASWLIEQGASLNIPDHEGLLPSYIAAYIGDIDLMMLMIKYGAVDLQTFQMMRAPTRGSLLYWGLYGANSIETASFLIEHRNEIVIDDKRLTEEEENAWMSWVNWFLNGGYTIMMTDRTNKDYQDRQNATTQMLDRKVNRVFIRRLLNRTLYQERDRDKRIEELLAFLRPFNNLNGNPINDSRVPSHWVFYSAAQEILSFIQANYHSGSSEH